MQSHLGKVYGAVAVAVASTALGVYLHMLTGFGGILSFLASLGMMFWILSDPEVHNTPKRVAMLCGYGALNGGNLGTLVILAEVIDPSVVPTALFATVTVFACFSGAALFAKRRSYLYLGGMLGSVLTTMMWVSLFNMFFRSALAFELNLWLGLFVFVGYVVYDTQVIVEQASKGDKDIVAHALKLYTDFVAIFVRIVIILLKNSQKKSSRK